MTLNTETLKRLELKLPPKDGPAVLLYDIETAPAKVYTWNAWNTNVIDTEEDWYLLSFAYRWLNQRMTTGFVSIFQDPEFYPDTVNDAYVVEPLFALFDAADIVIAHNGDNFDQKKSNSRFLYHGFGPPSPYQSIDTLKESRRYFSNYKHSLDEISRIYTRERKLATEGFILWRECMRGNPQYWRKMERYNRHDVKLLEKAYLKMRPWIGAPGKTAHPNMGHWSNDRVCTNCGSSHLIKRGFHRTGASVFQTLQCKTCGAYSREKKRMSEAGLR